MNKLENEIKETLKYLKPEKELKIDPYFYTRLQAKINEKQEEELAETKWSFGFLKPAILVLVIILNIFSAVYFLKSGDKENVMKSVYYSKFIMEYSNEYNYIFNYNSK